MNDLSNIIENKIKDKTLSLNELIYIQDTIINNMRLNDILNLISYLQMQSNNLHREELLKLKTIKDGIDILINKANQNILNNNK